MSPRLLGAAAVVVLLAGCGEPLPSATDPRPAVAIPEPGRPYDGAAVLAAMRESRRPGGVPDGMETTTIARAVADAIWTIDGQPWTTMSVGGSCGTASCTLDVAGSRRDRPGEDRWTFSVAPSMGEASVVDTSLGSMPAELVVQADELARGSEAGELLSDLVVASATWSLPPDDGQLVLAYRAGDEEGSCRRDVHVDLHSGEVTPGASADC